jgi:hypothetical protein
MTGSNPEPGKSAARGSSQPEAGREIASRNEKPLILAVLEFSDLWNQQVSVIGR